MSTQNMMLLLFSCVDRCRTWSTYISRSRVPTSDSGSWRTIQRCPRTCYTTCSHSSCTRHWTRGYRSHRPVAYSNRSARRIRTSNMRPPWPQPGLGVSRPRSRRRPNVSKWTTSRQRALKEPRINSTHTNINNNPCWHRFRIRPSGARVRRQACRYHLRHRRPQLRPLPLCINILRTSVRTGTPQVPEPYPKMAGWSEVSALLLWYSPRFIIIVYCYYNNKISSDLSYDNIIIISHQSTIGAFYFIHIIYFELRKHVFVPREPMWCIIH